MKPDKFSCSIFYTCIPVKKVYFTHIHSCRFHCVNLSINDICFLGTELYFITTRHGCQYIHLMDWTCLLSGTLPSILVVTSTALVFSPCTCARMLPRNRLSPRFIRYLCKDASDKLPPKSGKLVELSLSIVDQKHGKHYTKKSPGSALLRCYWWEVTAISCLQINNLPCLWLQLS
jgi:hypothetical protein